MVSVLETGKLRLGSIVTWEINGEQRFGEQALPGFRSSAVFLLPGEHLRAEGLVLSSRGPRPEAGGLALPGLGPPASAGWGYTVSQNVRLLPGESEQKNRQPSWLQGRPLGKACGRWVKARLPQAPSPSNRPTHTASVFAATDGV